MSDKPKPKKSRLGTLDGKMIEYDANNPEEKKKAFMEVFNLTSEQYDAQQNKASEKDKEYKTKYPLLNNLVWANNEMYYVDSQGKKTDQPVDIAAVTEEMVAEMKEINPDDTILVNGEKQSREEVLRADIAKAVVNPKP